MTLACKFTGSALIDAKNHLFAAQPGRVPKGQAAYSFVFHLELLLGFLHFGKPHFRVLSLLALFRYCGFKHIKRNQLFQKGGAVNERLARRHFEQQILKNVKADDQKSR